MGICRLGDLETSPSEVVHCIGKGLKGVHVVVIMAVVVEACAVGFEYVAAAGHIVHIALHKAFHGFQVAHCGGIIGMEGSRLQHPLQGKIDDVGVDMAQIGLLGVVARTVVAHPLDEPDHSLFLPVGADGQDGEHGGDELPRRGVTIAGEDDVAALCKALVEQEVEVVVERLSATVHIVLYTRRKVLQPCGDGL